MSFLGGSNSAPDSLVIASVEFLTADVANAGMSYWTGGKFYMKIRGAKGECSTGHLDNSDNNWQRGKVGAKEQHVQFHSFPY